MDYEPIPLAAFCNAGTAFLRRDEAPALGAQVFHGLPFEIAADPQRCLIGLGGEGGGGDVAVPLGRTVRSVLFAHVRVDSKILDGETPGRVVAQYVFRFADGREIVQPVRDRFEIGFVPTQWCHWPFLAVPDRKDRLAPRYEGRWDQVAARQMEIGMAAPKHFFLWAWKNPHPETPLESVVLRPAGGLVAVAALTLGHLDESPFFKLGAQAVKITLPDGADAQKPFNLEVEVDRGIATYPFALPEKDGAAFLAAEGKGWGEEQNPRSSPAYVEVAATPSATVTVKSGGEELGKFPWGDVESKGALENGRARLEIVDRGKNWVHVTVQDEETGRPVPCRVHFRSPEGVPYQPHGHHNHANSNLSTFFNDVGGCDLRLGQITYAFIDGRCQGWLPRGEVFVDVARGFEYQPLRTSVKIEPGQRELTLRIKRWTNMNAQGWFSGDPHVHAINTPGAHREAQGEDLNVVNLLATQLGHLFANTEDFIGGPTFSNGGRTVVYCSQENRQHMLGHLSLLGLKSPVMPWCTDGPGEAETGGTLEEVMSHWADDCRAQGGTVIIPHIQGPLGEPAVLVATGRADAAEMLHFTPYQHLEYYRYLNGGYRLPLVGGTDKMDSSVPVGLCRTYARIPAEEGFSYDAWCKAIRDGRTFLSSGPLLQFTVEGAQIGDTLNLPGHGGTVEVQARAESIFPIHCLQIVREGQVVAATEDAKGARSLSLTARLKVDRHTWLAARCGGPQYTALPHNDGWKRGIFAHTSPIYVAVGGEWWLFDMATAQYMLTLVEGGLEYIREGAVHQREGRVTHHHGKDDHKAYLEGPFHEARAAIHRRMHQLGIPH